MARRVAVLFDEDGKEIFRGAPSELPVRFVDGDGDTYDWTMATAFSDGLPIDDESGEDLEILAGE